MAQTSSSNLLKCLGKGLGFIDVQEILQEIVIV